MKKLFISIPVLLLLVVFILSCGKEGTGGKAKITFTVHHHDKPIPFTHVFIKYGTKSFPGQDTTLYDDKTVADADAMGEFDNLKKGDYYLYGVGYDSALPSIVYGGIPVKIKKADQTLDTNVPVTEP